MVSFCSLLAAAKNKKLGHSSIMHNSYVTKTAVCLATMAVLCLGQNPLEGQVPDNCSEKLKMAIDCWTWHTKIPKCGEKSSLMKCPEIYLPQIRDCDDEIKSKVHHRIEIYARTDKLLCGDKELHKDLEDDDLCWKVARSCAENIVNLENHVTSETCGETRQKIIDCIDSQSGRPNCHQLLKKYTSILLESTPCKVTGGSGTSSASALLAITATIAYLAM